MKNISCFSARVTCKINLSVKETRMLRLKIWIFSFLEERKYLTKNDRFFNNEKVKLEAKNNQEEYLENMKTMCCIVFLNQILIASSHIDMIMTNVILCMQKP